VPRKGLPEVCVERPFQAAMPAFERHVFEFDSKTTPARQPSLPA